MVKPPWPTGLVLRMQGLADSRGHSLSPGLLFSCQDLSSSSAGSRLLNTPKATSRSWDIRVCGPNCNFWKFLTRTGGRLADDMLSQQRLTLWSGGFNVSKFSTSLHKMYLKGGWVFTFFLGHSVNLFILNWLFVRFSHPL